MCTWVQASSLACSSSSSRVWGLCTWVVVQLDSKPGPPLLAHDEAAGAGASTKATTSQMIDHIRQWQGTKVSSAAGMGP